MWDRSQSRRTFRARSKAESSFLSNSSFVKTGLLIDTLRETPFWDRYFTVVDLLVGTENGYARTYGVEAVTTITT